MKLQENLKKLMQNGFLNIFCANILNNIISFITSAILIHILSKEEYGQFTYTWNILGFVMLANGMGVASSFLQISSEKYQNEEYCNALFFYGLKTGEIFDLFLMLLLIILSKFAPLNIMGSRKLLMLLCLLPCCQLVYDMISVYLRSRRRNNYYASLSIIFSSLLLLLATGMAFLWRTSGWIISYYLAILLSAVVGYRFCKINKRSSNLAINKEDKKDFLKVAVVSVFNDGISSALYLLDLFILGIIVPQEKVLASYKVATMIPTALFFIPTSIILYIYPYFAEHNNDKAWCRKNYKMLLWYFSVFNMLLISILNAFAPTLIRCMFGEQYLDCLPVFRILTVNFFVSASFMKIAGNILVTQRGLKYNFITVLIAGLTNIIGDYFLISRYGSIGGALSTLCSSVVGSIACVIFLNKKLKDCNKQI